mmetsp:Transcript_9851/g.23988  ORF Transcript_9851/g.23988 Transcript_9851/m.23988 type:complete len:326 (-) Transcript_9851:59-1036(-)|eukprot:CAMPEP_0197192204 /NCGR_PEP_ID=MMETSP1423-20130617/24703_1 /TAXON_ID=476441 /ORGANISM="Pseudo-nitzschia heimii, Strain UNC1101" /LENGTH=325 /DNA_ID=CAMNT_0042645043 /DNA_START=44 /DNA_END=1021 /DNA_ORIENTATION=-
MVPFTQISSRICGSFSSRRAFRIAGKLPTVFDRVAQNAFTSTPSENRRRLSSDMQALPPDDPQAQFQAKPPTELNMEMAKGIQSANHLILKYGVGRQRLELLSKEADSNMPLVIKWQRMMEIYLGAQLHVVAALGYQTDEQGIMMYTQQLAQFVGTKCDPATQDEFRATGRDTWREMLATAFDLDKDMIAEKFGNELSIVDARNIVHKVASALIEPNILEEVATRVGQLPPQSDPQIEMGLKHSIIQDVVVNKVYLGGDTPLTEELGFGSGPKGYALMQYVMAYHESDALCMQYTSSSMSKIWKAAGLVLGESNPAAAKLPMSGP